MAPNNESINIDSIKIPDFGWRSIGDIEDKNVKVWVHPNDLASISIHYLNTPPDIPTIKDINVLRSMLRNNGKNNYGIIKADIIDIEGIKSVEFIRKIPKNRKDSIDYSYSIIIPFEKCSYIINLHSPELGKTRKREATMMDRLLIEGKISIDKLTSAFYYPYDENIKDGILMSLSEEEIYDNKFPFHPLSIVRKLIPKIKKELEISSEIKDLPFFDR